MSAETKPVEKPATELAAKPAVTETQKPADTVDARAEFKATLAKFSAKFGAANGSQWAADGLTYEEALEKHVEALGTQLTAEQGKVTEAQTKLAAVPRGEETPVSFGTNEKHPAGGGTQAAPTGKFSQMGNVGKFAASIADKLPK